MDTDALRTFVAIHREQGFTPAAERLGRSQPAISRRIALLEAGIGMTLFERTAGGVTLSQAGQVLLPHAERVLAALRDAADAVADLRDGGGPVSLAVVGTLANAGLTAVLKRFAAELPQAEVTLGTATSDEVSGLVRRGAATIGLRYFEDRSPDLACRDLGPEPLVIACAGGHRLAGRLLADLAELKDERWLAFPGSDQRREASAAAIFTAFAVHGVTAVDWLPVDSLTAQKRLAEAGLGLVLLPESSIEEERAAGTLATIAVAEFDAFNPVVAVTRRGAYLSPASLRLLDLLESEFGAAGARANQRRPRKGR